MKLVVLGFLGACIGSFLGVVIDRFPHQSLLFPASHCNHCHTRLKPWDLLPIISQLVSRSTCRYCGATIPLWYLLLEASSAFLLVLTEQDVLSIGHYLVLLSGLVLAIYDIKHREYPLVVWLVFVLISLPFGQFQLITLICLLLGLLAYRFDLKMGSGDFLYLASISLMTNFQTFLWVIQLSSLLGILCFLLFKPKQVLPFIPFLVLAYGLVISIIGAL